MGEDLLFTILSDSKLSASGDTIPESPQTDMVTSAGTELSGFPSVNFQLYTNSNRTVFLLYFNIERT